MRTLALIVALIAPAVRAAQLPETHEYQKTLRAYLSKLTEQDLAVEIRQFKPPADKLSVDEQYRFWLLSGEQRPAVGGLALPAKVFTLAGIEGEADVMQPAAAAASLAWLARWDSPCNPYFNDAAVKRRAFVIAVIDMVMLDELHALKTGANRSDYLGGTLLWLTEAYAAARDILPAEVRAAYETGLRRFVERLRQWGPTGSMTDMDLFAPVSLKYASDLLGDDETKQLAREYSHRLFTDPRFFHPAGYFVDMGGFDATYNGISMYFTTWAAFVTDWPFVHEALAKSYRLRSHLMLPEPDGNWFGPCHFSSRTSADVAHDQWSWRYRHAGAAMLTDEAIYAAPQPPTSELQTQSGRFIQQLNSELGPGKKLAEPWKEHHWTHGTFTYDHYRPGVYGRTAVPVFAQKESFVREFEKTFLVAKYDNFGAILHTGLVPKEGGSEKMFGYSGGALSAFWTPKTGSVLLGRRGSYQGKTFDTWSDWQIWPVHALTGLTTDGKIITSARERSPKAEYNGGGVRVSGTMLVHNGTSDATYRRRFVVSEKGVEIESMVEGGNFSELYETLPVFLGDARQKDVNCKIEFQKDETGDKVKAVSIERFAGKITIEFDRPRRVKLSPSVWKDGYQSSAQCRNIMIDLLDGKPEVRYTIKP